MIHSNLSKFSLKYSEYGTQPNVYLLITSHLDNPSYQAIIRVALTIEEASYWLLNANLPGQSKKIQKILLYKQGEFQEEI